eukprot:TRINITY_DN1151_c1_g4_i1.p1 TRINITY_DN1151_c1_g4~~TRINITY_DN1151_c1_g4_i1.p1  ORF type:complete len:952 (+),score=251.93 TRINITY_DN1151_c1_g4_i1:26-2881(+)
MVETAILAFHAGVYQYQSSNFQWVPLATLATVWITHNESANMYRILARAGFTEQFVLNGTLTRSMAFEKASDLFLKWRDGDGPVLGFNFENTQTLNQFVDTLNYVSIFLTEPTGTSTGPLPDDGEELEEKKLSHRDSLAKEIHQSELSYVRSLQNLQKVWIAPLAAKNLLTPQEMKEIFSNVEQILGFSEKLVLELGTRLEKWGPTQKIGDVLERFFPFLKLYKTYCDNYELSMNTLEKLNASHPKKKALREFFKSAELHNGFQLSFYLIMPVQRVPRYTLLLKELLNHTDPSHPDYEDLKLAYSKAADCANDINQSVIQAEKNREMANLLNGTFEGLDALLAPHRNFIMDGSLSTTIKDVECNWVLLFNDLIAFTSIESKEKGKAPKRVIQAYLEFNTTWARPAPEMGDDAFELRTPDTVVFLRPYGQSNQLSQSSNVSSELLTSNPSKKKTTDGGKSEWFETIQNCIKNWLIQPSASKDRIRDEVVINRDLIKNNLCESRFGEYKFKDGGKYRGYWHNAKFHGTGKYESPNGTILEGRFERGMLVGEGTATYANGDKYEGEWLNELPHGKGKLTLSSGSTYDGYWVSGCKSGRGKMEWVNGDTYVGDWLEDRMNGQGVLTKKDGTMRYEGGFKEDMRHGQGLLTLKDYTFEGEWFNGQPHGKGKEVSTHGGIYEGEFKFGKKDGSGSWKSTDSTCSYLGDWRANKYDGLGVYQNKNLVYDGGWKDGKRNGKGKETTPEYVYDGNWEDNLYHGKGTWLSNTLGKYRGYWSRGSKHGYGTYTYPNGDEFTGEWSKDKKEGGISTYTWADGTNYKGHWLNDEPHGEGEFRFSTDTYYTGGWRQGLFHGQGTLATPQGVFSGEWSTGKREGLGNYKSIGQSFDGKWRENRKHGPGTFQVINSNNSNNNTSNNTTSSQNEIKQIWKDGLLTSPGIKYFAPDLPDPHIFNWVPMN